MLMGQIFDEMYPQYAGKFCQVIDNYDPRAEQLIDDFKGEGTNNDLTIAISVDMLDTGIDIGDIVEVEVPAVPLEDQQRISAILDKADEIRQKREKSLKLASSFLRAAFEQLFGDLHTNSNQ